MRNRLFIMTLVTQQQNGQLIIGTSSPVCRFAVTIHQEVTGENFGAKLLEPKSVCNLFPDFFLRTASIFVLFHMLEQQPLLCKLAPFMEWWQNLSMFPFSLIQKKHQAQ